ncbi:glycosyltransferase family 4 protein [Sphingomonas immobilis]|uniref:Glycosyltransferase family 4 protein n=1 Tax=Sphingomonas immobilis TaxID=3063997 RepID=A0ABT9A432_9SPHN|nr:glycosyltransferase family 4 protein [Sphingomonas sp. CA1-15]MDO7844599.1 glycosyltransferase family 4 protein [Sphingomonas sp. CA1-15]
MSGEGGSSSMAGAGRPIRALLVDSSFFTQPYDTALHNGLVAAGVEAHWLTRRLRAGEGIQLPSDAQTALFYPVSERGGPRSERPLSRLLKAAEHPLGLARMVHLARRYDVVHVQWAMVPAIDAFALGQIRTRRPVVFTVHDTQPFNGKAMNAWRTRGFERLFDVADALIVHTESGRASLIGAGAPAERIHVIPHGPLPLAGAAEPQARGARWRIVLFGRLQHYKGADLLVEALGRLDPAQRARIEVMIAGEPMIDLAPLRARAAELGIDGKTLRFEPRVFSDADMAALLAGADSFVLPYRAIDASGVLFLILGLGKWIVASDIGAFAETLRDGETGRLIPPGDIDTLAAALADAVGRKVAPGALAATGWDAIGIRTAELYRNLITARGKAVSR